MKMMKGSLMVEAGIDHARDFSKFYCRAVYAVLLS